MEETKNGNDEKRGTNTETRSDFDKSGIVEKRRGRPKKENKLDEENFGLVPLEVNVISSNEDIEIEKTGKRKYTKRKKENDNASVDDMTNVIIAICQVVAFATDPIFTISEDQAKSIATPLYNICKRYDVMEKMSNYSDIIALTTALSVTFIPKIVTYNSKKKIKKGEIDNDKSGEIPENGNELYSITGGQHKKSIISNDISSIKTQSITNFRKYWQW